MVIPAVSLQRLEVRSDDDAIPRRIGQVVSRDAIAPALGGADDSAFECRGIGRLDRVVHVARLQVGEALTVRDDELHRLDVRVVDSWVVDVAQDAVGDREPDLRGRVPSGAEAILPSEIEVRQTAWAIRSAASSPTGHRHKRSRHRGADKANSQNQSSNSPSMCRLHAHPSRILPTEACLHYPNCAGGVKRLTLRLFPPLLSQREALVARLNYDPHLDRFSILYRVEETPHAPTDYMEKNFEH